jgi:hypothetical protein
VNAYLYFASCLSYSSLFDISLLSVEPYPFVMSTPYGLPSDASSIKPFEWDDKYDFPRDLVGYGEGSFNPQWPGGAKLAVSFVINYEEVCAILESFECILTTV